MAHLDSTDRFWWSWSTFFLRIDWAKHSYSSCPTVPRYVHRDNSRYRGLGPWGRLSLRHRYVENGKPSQFIMVLDNYKIWQVRSHPHLYVVRLPQSDATMLVVNVRAWSLSLSLLDHAIVQWLYRGKLQETLLHGTDEKSEWWRF